MKTILLQADAGLGIVQFLIVAAVCLGLFLLLRFVMLWYWRVDEIVKNQEKQNQLLESILRKLESWNDNKNAES